MMKLMKKGTIHDVINGWQQNEVDVGDDALSELVTAESKGH